MRTTYKIIQRFNPPVSVNPKKPCMDAMQESLASWFDQLALKFGERRIGWDCWLQGGAVGANPADGMLDLVEQVDRVEVYVGIQDAELTQADMLSGMSFEVVAFTPPALWR